jgi:hypothetical protein
MKSSLHRLIPFLCHYSAAANSKVSTLHSATPTTWSSARTTKKTAFVVKEACLMVRYLAIGVLLMHAYASLGCVYRVVA